MKKNSPRQTGFSFLSDLPPEEFILRIPRQVKEYAAEKGELLYREILREDGNKEVWLGLERGDHAGYWYCSVVEKTAAGCSIRGKIVYDPDGYTKGGRSGWLEWIGFALLFVVFLVPVALFALGCLLVGSFQKKPPTKEERLDEFMCEYINCKKVFSE